MPEKTTTPPETDPQDPQTPAGTDRPEHHQTQAAEGSPQADGAPAANAPTEKAAG